MAFADLVTGIVNFQEVTHTPSQAKFAELAKGQSPDTLLIGCADSRLVPSLLTASGPGDVFVTRNPGNLVPASSDEAPAEATLASLEYAVLALKVQHIVICGHSDCGAMKAVQAGGAEGLPHVVSWLGHGEALMAEAASLDLPTLTERNIAQQLAHLRSHSFVAERETAGELHLHGWYYDIGAGEVRVLDEGVGQFVAAVEAYSNLI